MDDSGLYEAEIIGRHPAHSGLTEPVKREYWVTVEAAPPTKSDVTEYTKTSSTESENQQNSFPIPMIIVIVVLIIILLPLCATTILAPCAIMAAYMVWRFWKQRKCAHMKSSDFSTQSADAYDCDLIEQKSNEDGIESASNVTEVVSRSTASGDASSTQCPRECGDKRRGIDSTSSTCSDATMIICEDPTGVPSHRGRIAVKCTSTLVESDSPASMTVNDEPNLSSGEDGNAGSSTLVKSHVSGTVLPHGSSDKLAASLPNGEPPAIISDGEVNQAAEDILYKDSPVYPIRNQHSRKEPQNINIGHDAEPAHQREYVAEPRVEWCLSEDQRAKREGLKKLELNSKPVLKDFMNRVAPHIPDKWMEIGIQLDIPKSRLQSFDQQHHGHSTRIFVEVFSYWEKQPGDKPKTWSTVVNALKTPSVGEHSLAHTLESMLTSTTSLP